ncbi:MAG: SMC-Scp complex subunit ScpB [Kiritimatiellae bacterium]|nr:SMC-Scp complex subunit ScpB [Kiritimatiellia bacterium]MDD4341432.1 SMC-Scp complex subunit ScpB [Kiritimatiellia bacterium]
MNEFVLPELKQIIGAMLFVRKEPLTVAEIRRVLTSTAERRGGITVDFAKANEKRVREAVAEIEHELTERKLGFHIIEVAGGWRLENDANCGPWLRVMLQKGRGTRLSLPALETLAIVAYRQPCVRSEIEAVRGVAVDAILRNLLEMQLVRVIGRSELPGRPWMFGTTQKFMEHFGLKSLDDLPGTDELRRMEAQQSARAKKAAANAETDSDEEDGQMTLPTSDETVASGANGSDAQMPAAEAEDEETPIERDEISENDIVGGEEETDAVEEKGEDDEDEFDDDDDFDDDEFEDDEKEDQP